MDAQGAFPEFFYKIIVLLKNLVFLKGYSTVQKRSMELLYYEAAVPAGFPSPALDYLEDRIDLSKDLIRHPASTFIVECTGDSMMGAFIPPKARLVVDRSLTPVNGNIVVAVLNGEFTVKFIRKNCLLYTSPSPRDRQKSRMPSSA